MTDLTDSKGKKESRVQLEEEEITKERSHGYRNGRTSKRKKKHEKKECHVERRKGNK